ncbi:hypothetical protein [Vibrio parahaemolyticus]|uniref:hypothetical protein n=1 Tax=Vibrio parahaemolyticus TaxID=670 RepID=UPI0024905810|nr:hypothetical protein [Vibrio parahaemolyticus]
MSSMIKRIDLIPPPERWLSAYCFEKILLKQNFPTGYSKVDICFVIPEGVGFPLETIVRLLNVCNQLVDKGHKVQLEFANADCGLMGYCKYMRFFDNLDARIQVTPCPTTVECEDADHPAVVKMEVLNCKRDLTGLAERLAKSIRNGIELNPEIELSDIDKNKLERLHRTIITELINNVQEHSETQLNGFATMQVYGGKRPRASLVICDSGLGVFNTLKASEEPENAHYKHESCENIIKRIFDEGVTRKKHDDGGSGLQTCFNKALKMNSDITIRTDCNQFRLFKLADHNHPIDALKINDNFMDIKGTFLCFEIPLVNKVC